jgi:hypothetical protein
MHLVDLNILQNKLISKAIYILLNELYLFGSGLSQKIWLRDFGKWIVK